MKYVYNVVVCKKYLAAKARKLSILPTLLNIFDIRQHYICILYLR